MAPPMARLVWNTDMRRTDRTSETDTSFMPPLSLQRALYCYVGLAFMQVIFMFWFTSRLLDN